MESLGSDAEDSHIEWVKPEKVVEDEKKDVEETKPLLDETEEKKRENFVRAGIRFLYQAIECCLPLFFAKKKETEQTEDIASEDETKPIRERPTKLDVFPANDKAEEAIPEPEAETQEEDEQKSEPEEPNEPSIE